METTRLTIVTPSGLIFDDNVKSVTLPGKEGEFGVLPNHASLLSSLTVGVVIIEKINGSNEAVAINWGYAQVGERSVDVIVDGAVALSKGLGSETSKNIEEAKKLINSVKDANVHLAAIEAKINSFA